MYKLNYNAEFLKQTSLANKPVKYVRLMSIKLTPE